ncbi:MAG: V-type ATPase 116kDa subunit family protein [Dysgonamonadaceae bacterium]|nr:V-type ATPase 116kDa subunit family protein [Dysgonamonadaceae bacterium]MDD3727567.1 V-type ATPase 116kDa subunit family protein [Dysgonamonadaceae bacterium]MDD4245847.1 V-type ATPase 116kDa subunit family protein [Dysgonamonadaceae bacterium]
MVKKMRKFSFLIYHNDYDLFLKDLRELGLIHVAQQDKEVPESDELNIFMDKLKKLQEAKKRLKSATREDKVEIPLNVADTELGYKIPGKIEEIQDRITTLEQQIQVSSKEYDALLPWGDFKPENINKLEQAGYVIDFFSIQKSAYNPEWEEMYNAIVINDKSSRLHFVTITKQNNVSEKLQLESAELPDISLKDLSALIKSLKIKREEEVGELKALSADIPSIDAAIADIESQISLKKVILNTNQVADNKLMLMQGWAPADKELKIVNYLQSKDAYYEVNDPDPEDDVPIKFKNNKFFKLFEPITKLYMLPKYNELDLTPYFAPFFMIFFGLSLGDIGYGLFLFVLATAVKIWKRSTMEDSMKSVLSLVQVLGVSAFFTGFLTGGFFGVQIYDFNTSFTHKLRDKVFLDNNMMFNLSLILGTIQVIFGMVIKVFNRTIQFGFVYGISTIGWIVLLLSIIFAAIFPTLLPMMGTTHLIILAISGIAIFLINSPGKNIFLNLGLGLWDTYNMATGLLGDILSYVRLFALGLSGGILAMVFTDLALGMSPDNIILGPLVTIIIFVVGHSINIFMNTLGAIVHPMRLTFVEFFKNSEFSGGGQKYQPFT